MSKYLQEKRNDLIKRAEEVLEKAKNETRELTSEEATEVEGIIDEVRNIDNTMNLDNEIRAMKETVEKHDNTPTEEDIKVNEETRALENAKMEERAFEEYIRGAVLETRDGDTPTDVNMTKSDNGAVIPSTIANKIIKRVYDVCPILARSHKYNVKGTLTIPKYDETTNAITVAYQTEFSGMTSSVGAMGTQITLTGYLAGALSKISRSLINNVEFDIVGFVVNEMGDHIARFIEHELIVGTNNKVTGLSTNSNTVTTASATAITADELIDVQDSVKDVYQSNAIWIMSPATRTAIRKLKDSDGRYMMNDDITSPFGTTLLGKPVFVSDNMEDIAASKKVIFYGDMSGLATKFNEQISVQVLREKYADEHAVGVIGWFEFDSKIEDNQKIAGLVCHA